jgi:beta-glucosidase
MARKDEAGEDREGLLRKPVDETNRSSIDSIEAADFLATQPPHDSSRAPAYAYQTRKILAELSNRASRRSKCLIIALVVGIIFWSILAAGGYWLYTNTPPDGLSPPWYPSPPGGTVSSWAESYAKASKLVAQMSLVEKVNITTGTGTFHDSATVLLCGY